MRSLFLALATSLLFATHAAAEPLAWQGPVPEELVARSHFIEVEGHQWHYVSSGEGPPLVLLHGLPVQSYLWRGVIPELAATHRVIVPDILGYGRSDKDDSITYDPGTLARHFEAFMEAMDFQEPVVLGVSDLGSVLGLHWASEHEEDVRGLILVEAVIRNGEDFYKAASFRMKAAFSTLRKNEKMAYRLIVEKNMGMQTMLPAMTLRDLSEAEQAEYEQAWADPEVRARVLLAAGPSQMPKKGRTTSPDQGTALMDAYAPWLASTEVPKLVLAAKPGLLIRRDEVKYIESTFENTTVVSIGKGKHFVQEDQPEAISSASAAWLATLPASRRP